MGQRHTTRVERKIRRVLADLGPGAQQELLRVLRSSPEVRADVIRQFYERAGKQGWAELFIDLEEDELARTTVIEILENLLAKN